MVQRVAVSGEKLQPALNARVVLTDFCEVLQRLVVRIDSEGCTAQIATKAFDRPDDGASF